MQRRPEKQLLKAIRAGERAACEKLVKDYYQRVYRFLVHLTGDAGRADDLTQETFTAAWSSIGGFKGRCSIASWLHRIAYSKFVDAGRKSRQLGNLQAQARQKAPRRDETAEPMQRLMTEERDEELYQALRRLKHDDQVVIVLHYFQDMSYREMAAVLGKPTGTVKWRTSRALKKLKKILTQENKP
ncbi:RNA polymerase sigma factor [Planctomycetota bacterium]